MTSRHFPFIGIAIGSALLLAVSGMFLTIRAQSSNFFDSFDHQNSIVFPVPSPQPSPVPADVSIAEYTQCMQSAVDEQESGLLQAHQMYHDRLEQLIEQRWQARRQTYTIVDNRQRRNYEREVDRFYRESKRELDRAFDDVEDAINDTYRNDKRECDRLKREIEKEARRIERDRRVSNSSSTSVFGEAPSTFQPSYAPAIEPLYQPAWTFSDSQTF